MLRDFSSYKCQIQTNFYSLENLRAVNVDIRGSCFYWLWKEGRSKRVNRQNYPPSLRWTFCSTSVKFSWLKSTRCDFISAVLSNKFLYKVWSPTPFERTLVYCWMDSLQFLMKKIAKVRESTEMFVWLRIPWDGQRDVAREIAKQMTEFLRKIFWRCPWHQKTKGLSLKDVP